MKRLLATLLLISLLSVFSSSAPLGDTVLKVRSLRTAHEREIVKELLQFLSIPNVASNVADIRRNADLLKTMFERRGFHVELIQTPGSPVFVATRDYPGASSSTTFYLHFDGQPVDPKEWQFSPPFAPVMVVNGKVVPSDTTPINPETRVYARSASDDKGPIVAMLAALDALKAAAIEPTRNLRIILDGEEEAGSPNFEKAAVAHAALLHGDVAIGIDGPRHASGRPTMNFGDRGNVGALITVYGANHDLHSGNYGNWAPDPSMLLARLLASMKDDHGRVQIAGFYDDVVPLTAAERKAIDEIPNVEPALMQQFGFSRSEHPDSRLEYQHNLPTLTITGLESGTVRGQGRTIIAASASARLDMRLVMNLTPEKQFARLVEHIRKQGFFIADGDPDAKTRAAHPLIASVTRTGGTAPFRTLMDDPQAKRVSDALVQFGQVVRLPTIGATGPRSVLADALHMPTVGISIVNFDNNQHGPNENVRIQNLWDGVEIIASVLTMAK